MDDRFRYEHKYLISRQAAELLRCRLRCALRPDPNACQDGGYHVRSVYFDDTDFTAYREKLDGLKERSKLRIRCYNLDPGRLVLEKKERNGDLCRKLSQVIPRETARSMLAGGKSGGGSPLLEEFDALRVCAGLRPVVLVDYRRFAFTFPVSDVRVTLDCDLCTPVYSTDLFNTALACYPVFDDGEALLELKYSGAAPSFVLGLLEDIPKVKVAMSKYTRCLSMANG